MGDSLRANAERILRDVQGVHSRMAARIDQAEGNRGAPAHRRSRSAGGRELGRGAFDGQTDGEIPDVPEFIPPR